MSNFFTKGQRKVQAQSDSTRLADAVAEGAVHSTITDEDRSFIEDRDMFFLATIDADGRVNCSYKGGLPGFVRVIDEHTIAFPVYDGNGMFMTAGSIIDNGEVGLLFIDFEEQMRMRLNGVASLNFDDPILRDYPEAQYIVRVKAREVFINCPRYIHKLKLVEHSAFVPQPGIETPIADWKSNMIEHGAGDLLSSQDPALTSHDPDGMKQC